jgi:hypothetical protein
MRYWDGGCWAQPPGPTMEARQVRQHVPTVKPDPTLAWVIALAPLAVPLVAFLAPEGVATASFCIIAVMIACAAADSKRLQRHGVEATWWWAVLMGVVYLAVRAKRSGTTVAIPVVGGVVVVASLLLSFTAAAVVSVPGGRGRAPDRSVARRPGVPRPRLVRRRPRRGTWGHPEVHRVDQWTVHHRHRHPRGRRRLRLGAQLT